MVGSFPSPLTLQIYLKMIPIEFYFGFLDKNIKLFKALESEIGSVLG